MSLRTTRAAALSAALLLPAAAMAQDGPPALPKEGAAQVDKHIRHLHDQLGITPAEQPQWDKFAQVMRDNATQMNQTFVDRGSKIGAATAADNMKSYADLAQVHADNMKKLATAFQALYDGFPDAQKQAADKVFRDEHAKRSSAKG